MIGMDIEIALENKMNLKNLTNMDIVITGLQSWDIEIGSNCKNLAIEFSKTNRVLYVNPPIDRLTAYLQRKSNGTAKFQNDNLNNHINPIEVKENLWIYDPEIKIESIGRLPFNMLFDVLNKRNNRLFANDIKKAMHRLGFTNHIHFCDSDMFRSFYLKEYLSPLLYIYYTRDNLQAVDYWKLQGKRIEPLHIKKADLVLANSPYLAQIATVHNPESYFVGQGCDIGTFKPDRIPFVPADIAPIRHPIIGYIGSLNSLRLDIKILEFIAVSKPEWNMVLVGPEDNKFKNSSLHELPNVWFLGPKNENELPAYLNSFDVAINPQLVNDLTIGNYPRKIDEYLSMGKPVVATRTVTMRYFSGYVSLANNFDDWILLINNELNNDSPKLMESRMNFAGQHTWEQNSNKIFAQIANLLNNKK
jgi:glycosyltransferase involved in cell wall biosynthesis